MLVSWHIADVRAFKQFFIVNKNKKITGVSITNSTDKLHYQGSEKGISLIQNYFRIRISIVRKTQIRQPLVQLPPSEESAFTLIFI